jgi:hypothetical protein
VQGGLGLRVLRVLLLLLLHVCTRSKGCRQAW